MRRKSKFSTGSIRSVKDYLIIRIAYFHKHTEPSLRIHCNLCTYGNNISTDINTSRLGSLPAKLVIK